VDRWEELFRAPNLDTTASLNNAIHTGKVILVSGAGGCIGSALARAIAAANPRFLILLDHSEENLYQIQMQIAEKSAGVPHAAILGDIADRELLKEIFQNHCPDIVYHVAAYKHVPLMEENALAVIRNNVLGTQVLAETAAAFEVPRFLMISTDKAVNPRSAMGVSKRVAEMVLLRLSNATTRMSAVRFGNVFGSNGSVVPRFLEQIANGGPVTVTHPDVARYFITLPEAVEIILAAAALEDAGIFVPDLGKQIKIVDLANHMIADAETISGKRIALEIVGMRPGEKMSEKLVSEGETSGPTRDAGLHLVKSAAVEESVMDAALETLARNVMERNLAGALEIVAKLVPEYVPSETLSEFLNSSAVREKK
jgi:FlaA1/EpsC-like NDP-sugar epimerase